MPKVWSSRHPYMRLGTPAHTGPYARLRGNYLRWLEEGAAAWPLIVMGQGSVRQAAGMLGLSPTTAWRRAWWYHDHVVLNRWDGFQPGPVPHQRGTRAVPHGRPYSLPRDAPELLRDIRDRGYSFADIVASQRTVPKCVRDLAAAGLADLAELAEEFRNDFDVNDRRELAEESPALYRDLMHVAGLDLDPFMRITYTW